jgi:hypothetical protein
MDAYERNNIYIAELGCTMGQAWGALKKSLRQLKYCYNLSIGDYDRVEELKARISCIRSAMGLENEEIYSSLCTIKLSSSELNLII